MEFFIPLLFLLMLMVAPKAAGAEMRLALVVTNRGNKQEGAELSNTHRDGDLVKAALERVGFKVWVVRDAEIEAV